MIKVVINNNCLQNVNLSTGFTSGRSEIGRIAKFVS